MSEDLRASDGVSLPGCHSLLGGSSWCHMCFFATTLLIYTVVRSVSIFVRHALTDMGIASFQAANQNLPAVEL